MGISVDLKVEDLLASIRKAVDDDIDSIGSSTAGQARGTLMRGALREMRINMDQETHPASAQGEISDLRERIKRSVADSMTQPAKALVPAPVPAERPRAVPAVPRPARNDFSGILGGAERRAHSAPPPFRPSLAETDDFADARYVAPTEHHARAPQWDEQPAYEAYEQHDPYAGRDTSSYGAGNYPALQAPLLSRESESAAEQAFRQLSDTLLSRATGDRSLEDVTRELLRGMLKQWLDANLPQLVEDLVREEIERVARRGR